jgi:hypothetical protein
MAESAVDSYLRVCRELPRLNLPDGHSAMLQPEIPSLIFLASKDNWAALDARLHEAENDIATCRAVFEAAVKHKSKAVLSGLIVTATVAGKVDWALQMQSLMKAQDPSLCKEVRSHSREKINELVQAQRMAAAALEKAAAERDLANLQHALVLAKDARMEAEVREATKLLVELEANVEATKVVEESSAEEHDQQQTSDIVESFIDNSGATNTLHGDPPEAKLKKGNAKTAKRTASSKRNVKRMP